MAITTFNIGPTGRNPDAALGEYNYAYCVCDAGGGTFSIVSAGGGALASIAIFTAPTSIKLHDVKSTGTPGTTNLLAQLPVVANKDSFIPFTFSQGLQVVVVGAGEFTFGFRGAQTTSPRTFGVTGNTP